MPKTVGICPATCCDKDFCNDHCTNGTTTSTAPMAMLSTKPLTKSTIAQPIGDPTTPVIVTTESSTSSSTTVKTTTAATTKKSTTPETTKATTHKAPTTIHGMSGLL